MNWQIQVFNVCQADKMPSLGRSEERFPLLMLFLDDGTKSNKKQRKIFIDKNRYKNITSGASAVITEWPSKFVFTIKIIFIYHVNDYYNN